MADSGGSKLWTVLSLVSALGAATLAKKALDTGWKAATGKHPPENPADPDVQMAEAVAWAVVSGTFYVAVPPGAGAIRFEDPRLAMMMAAPPRKKTAPAARRSFVTVQPKAGQMLLWESWLRHGVDSHGARGQRISVSFNYRLD